MYKVVKAWWLRNFVYSKSQMFEIVFDNFEPKLLDVMCAGEGRYYVYLGRKKFVQTKVKI